MKNDGVTKVLLAAFIAVNAGVTIWHGSVYRRLVNISKKPSYDYHGTSIPLIHPMQDSLPLASLTLQASTHYNWSDVTDEVNLREWYSLLHYPALSILGEPHRMTITSWYHNLHCISQLRSALANRNDPIANRHHFDHCLQYLRQLLLCGATDMLEEGDWMKQQGRVGPDLVCYDWQQAHSTLQSEYDAFREWKDNGQLD